MSASDPSKSPHLDASGRARMVDVGDKETTDRRAVAAGRLQLSPAGWEVLQNPGPSRKGDALAVAQVAAVQAVKRTPEWIPLAHPLPVTGVEIEWRHHAQARVLEVEVAVRVRSRTGVEMEALTACSAALLTVYDMLKGVDRGMVLGPIWLRHKSGGRSGDFRGEDPDLAAPRGS